MVKKLSCVSCGSLKRFPHTFTNAPLCSMQWILIINLLIPNSKIQIIKGDFHVFFQVDHTYKLYYGGAQKRPDGNYVNIIRNVEGKHVAEVGQANRKGIFLCWQNIVLSANFSYFLMANFAICKNSTKSYKVEVFWEGHKGHKKRNIPLNFLPS